MVYTVYKGHSISRSQKAAGAELRDSLFGLEWSRFEPLAFVEGKWETAA